MLLAVQTNLPPMSIHCRILLVLIVLAGSESARAVCQTNLTRIQTMALYRGANLMEPSYRFPFVAYFFKAGYGNVFNSTRFEAITDECARQPFSRTLSESTVNGSLVRGSVTSKGLAPDFRFRIFGSLSHQDAENIPGNLGGQMEFRFRDVLTLQTSQTNPVTLAITIQLDGNVSLPDASGGVVHQLGTSDLNFIVEDVTYCQGLERLVDVVHQSQSSGPDYNRTFVVTVCPKSVVRLDIYVKGLATVFRFSNIGGIQYSGGSASVDYTQCVTGNQVCFDDCAAGEENNCSGLSIRARVIESPTAAAHTSRNEEALGSSVRIVSASGYDYTAPLAVFRPELQIENVQDQAVLAWPARADNWLPQASTNLIEWYSITNAPSLDLEAKFLTLRRPLIPSAQFFRLQQRP